MGKRYKRIEDAPRDFIARQHVFFTASAAAGSRINLSPRSTDLLRVLDASTVAYLDRTGSGNETAAHVLADGRLTIMMCAFEGPPSILRLYGTGTILRRGGAEYSALLGDAFDGCEPFGARQIVRLDVDLVQTSCGYGVPLFDYREERVALDRWTTAKDSEAIEAYQRENNAESMDGLPTGLFSSEG